MRARSVYLICLALAAVEAWAQAPRFRPQTQPQAEGQPASVRGAVVNALTDEPIGRAEVKLTKWGNEPRTFAALTTPEGRFSMTGMPAGEYGVRVERPGFGMPEDGATQPPLRLAAGENHTDFKVRLVPCGAITGRVLDSAGEPMESVRVAIEGGVGPVGARTDEEGRFRLGGLAPGKYRVRAWPVEPQMQPEIRTDGTEELHHVPTYYPGSLNAKGASRVQVQAGRETGGIEIRLVRMPIVRLSGQVVGMPPNSNVMVHTMARTGSGMGAKVKPDGSFEIWRPMPGKYGLNAAVMGAAGEELQTAAVDVEVSDSSIEDIVLSFAPPINIAGRIAEDGAPPSGPQQQGQQAGSRPDRRFPLNVTFVGAGNRFRPGGRANIGADRTFELKNLVPDRYTVNMFVPQGYVKAVKAGQVETEGPVVDLRQVSGDTDITIVIGYGTGSISGSVRGDGDVAGTIVMLLPDDDPFGGPLSTTTVDQDGSYTLRNVAPRKYRLLAVDRAQRRDVQRAQDLDPHADFIETVEVRAGENTTKDVRKYAEEEK